MGRTVGREGLRVRISTTLGRYVKARFEVPKFGDRSLKGWLFERFAGRWKLEISYDILELWVSFSGN